MPITFENIMLTGDIDHRLLLPETVKFIQRNLEQTYRDSAEHLREHLYSIEHFAEILEEDEFKDTPKPVKYELNALYQLGSEKAVSYIRLTF